MPSVTNVQHTAERQRQQRRGTGKEMRAGRERRQRHTNRHTHTHRKVHRHMNMHKHTQRQRHRLTKVDEGGRGRGRAVERGRLTRRIITL